MRWRGVRRPSLIRPAPRGLGPPSSRLKGSGFLGLPRHEGFPEVRGEWSAAEWPRPQDKIACFYQTGLQADYVVAVADKKRPLRS